MTHITVAELMAGKRAQPKDVQLSGNSDDYQRLMDGAANIARHNHRSGDGKFAVKPASPGKPANTSLRNPKDGTVLLVKVNGIWHTSAGVAMSYGVGKPMQAPGVHSLIPLSSSDVEKLLQKVSDACGEDMPASVSGGTGSLAAAKREGRVSSTGPRSGFGVPVRTAKGGGLVEAANALQRQQAIQEDRVRPQINAKDLKGDLLTPVLSDNWLYVGDQPSNTTLFSAMQDTIKDAGF